MFRFKGFWVIERRWGVVAGSPLFLDVAVLCSRRCRDRALIPAHRTRGWPVGTSLGTSRST